MVGKVTDCYNSFFCSCDIYIDLIISYFNTLLIILYVQNCFNIVFNRLFFSIKVEDNLKNVTSSFIPDREFADLDVQKVLQRRVKSLQERLRERTAVMESSIREKEAGLRQEIRYSW